MKKYLFYLSTFLLPSIAYSHTVGGGGFLTGLTHPVLGVDHLLAMVSVGILSTQLGGRALWSGDDCCCDPWNL